MEYLVGSIKRMYGFCRNSDSWKMCFIHMWCIYLYICSILMSFAACQMILCERSKFFFFRVFSLTMFIQHNPIEFWMYLFYCFFLATLERSTSCQIKSPPWSVNKTTSKRTKPSTVRRGWKSTFQQSLPGRNKVESSIFAMPLEQKAAKSLNLAGAGNCC